MTVIIFLLVLAILIFVHELGHFLIAKACGIRVDAFALGFGPKIFSKQVGEVLYSLNLIPFGGYVKIFGENPDDESINGENKHKSFVHKSKLEQIAVLSAGVVFNFIFASILISIALNSGVLASVESYPQYTDRMTNQHIAVTYLNPGSPADKAGLKVGDEITAKSVEEVQKMINESKDKGVSLKIKRDGQVQTIKVIAEQGIVEGKYAIGIAMDNAATLQLPLFASIVEGVKLTKHMITETFSGLWDLIVGIFNGKSKLASVTGPVGIAGLVGDAAKQGIAYLLMFTAMISINLGVLNLVPFPALDGGRIFFVIIEAIIRRPLKPVFANTANGIGFCLLILLMIVVTYRDIANLFVK